MQKTALIIEDDINIADLIHMYLEKDDFKTIVSHDGNDGIENFKYYKPDIIILDLMLPSIDGWEILRQIRKTDNKTPVIILSARSDTVDKVGGLDIGADDYLTKPFEAKELLARVHAVMRRSAGEEEKTKIVDLDKLRIDLNSYDLVVNGVKTNATPKEIELLFYLASHPDKVFARNQLLSEIWGFDYFGDSRTVDVHIKRIREKLVDISSKWEIKTVWGIGYKFGAAEEKESA